MDFLLEAIAEHLISVCPECKGNPKYITYVDVPGPFGCGGQVVKIECKMCKKLRGALELSRDPA